METNTYGSLEEQEIVVKIRPLCSLRNTKHKKYFLFLREEMK